MAKIKFSHRYEKLGKIPNRSYVVLLQVFEMDYKQLSESFIEYDTIYIDEESEEYHYDLPKTKLLVLLFIGRGGEIFTTIRRFTPSKFEYYRSLENKELELVILDEEGEQ